MVIYKNRHARTVRTSKKVKKRAEKIRKKFLTTRTRCGIINKLSLRWKLLRAQKISKKCLTNSTEYDKINKLSTETERSKGP